MKDASLRNCLVNETVATLVAGEPEPSLRDLAARLGVSAMAPYRHFPNKAALMEAVSERGFAMLEAQLKAADAAKAGAPALVAQGLAYFAFAITHRRLFDLMFREGTRAGEESPARQRAFGVLYDRVVALAPEDAEAVALACWALVHGLAVLQSAPGGPEQAARVRDVLTLFVNRIARV
ncbi:MULTISPECIES: TetR/AcrR family transcriptional regulator [unclassified Sphingobium]|uniref:TetR/AcrR family transcriptional regulator n=1 Tax=unclassified Sphingobium TaxID=2611147 RepID=UPI002224CA18|nr:MULTISPECIES: TetR/AcrR family transcriptional regulator [unclassified Sphingobium]MCW2413250.1 AcrR family transcriptional regulator [Sphingobium sp. B8D3D]MCW2414452.1 AcrR family transcriptional regulator [Sphingobium sp. B8D3A]